MAIDIDIARINKALDDSGLTISDASKIFHVSRQTLYNWKNGRRTNSAFVLNVINRLVTSLENAIAAKELPLGLGIPPKEKLRQVNEIIRRHAR